MKRIIRFIIISICISIVFLLNQNVFADGFIVVPDHPQNTSGSAFPLEVKYHRVKVEINDQSAVTYIDQEFYNPTGSRLEGYYIFPIPEQAVIKKFSMYINGSEMQAELLEAQKARKIYEDIVRRSLDPALLEYQDRGLFKARIFPIEPRSVKRIKISYSQLLTEDNNTIEYVYPLNTEKFSAKPLKDVSVDVDLKTKNKLKNLFSTTHDIECVRKSDYHALLSWEANNLKPDMDFIFYYDTDRSGIGLSLLTYRDGKSGYFYLSANPGFGTGNEISNKDITFVLDTSGSMKGRKLEQAKRALYYCVSNMNKNDRFQIVRFSTEAEKIFSRLMRAEKNNIAKAKSFINDLQAIGGTNIEEALKLGLPDQYSKGRPHIIIFITDGKPTVGETREDKLLQNVISANKNNARIFTFGIGYDINTHLLDKITLNTKAFRYYINPKERIDQKISGFYKKIQAPLLTDVRLYFEKIKTVKSYPKNLPDLFRDTPLVVLGEYKGHGESKIILEGMLNGKKRRFEYKADFPKYNIKNNFIPPLWAARHVAYLLDQIRLNGESKELIEEITETARKYGIITPYTSYLILEDERERVAENRLRDDDQTLGKIASQMKDLAVQSEKEYGYLKRKSGEESIMQSREIQKMNKASNLFEARQGKDRLIFNDKSGVQHSVTTRIKNISGRAFYNTGKFWVDSFFQSFNRNFKIIKIKFASSDYFNLIKRRNTDLKIISLGRNVRFIMNNTAYEIYE